MDTDIEYGIWIVIFIIALLAIGIKIYIEQENEFKNKRNETRNRKPRTRR